MRTLARNKQKMYYALLLGEQEVPVVDKNTGEVIIDYVDDEGVEYPRMETMIVYSAPQPFKGNIAGSGGEVEVTPSGINVGDYEAILTVIKGELPIDETSLIWYETEPKIMANGYVDQYSADYTVSKVPPSLDNVNYLLKKVVK